MECITVPVHHCQNLFSVITDGHDQAPAIGKLGQQIIRNIRAGTGSEDAIKGGFAFPAKTAIGMLELNLGNGDEVDKEFYNWLKQD